MSSILTSKYLGGGREEEKKLEQTNVCLAPLLEGEAEGQVRLPVMDWQRSSQRGFAFLRSLVSCRLIINHRAQENGQEEETQAACNSSVASANSSLYRRAFVLLSSVRGGSEALSWGGGLGCTLGRLILCFLCSEVEGRIPFLAAALGYTRQPGCNVMKTEFAVPPRLTSMFSCGALLLERQMQPRQRRLLIIHLTQQL